jgi:predicted O-methyltransferase YrrM
MYSSLTLLRKYIEYLWKASNGHGHGVHSPFVFSFIKLALNKKVSHPLVATIEHQRRLLESNKEKIEVWDQGAGSRQNTQNERAIQQIAKAALKPKKYSQLLYKIVAYFQPENIVEMGTSLGITTCYLSIANTTAQVVTMEGAPNVANVAKEVFKTLGIQNIRLMEGNFDSSLPQYLSSIDKLGLAYVDGNHRYEPTLRYFELLLQKTTDESVIIFDDIHWSAEMEKAWEEIKKHPSVTLTIDLFFIGLVFRRKAQKEKEHFIIRY